MKRFPAIVAAVLAAAPLIGVATPAAAAQPTTAKTWSALLYRGLNASAEAARWRTQLPSLRHAVTLASAAVGQATNVQATAQAGVTAATTANRLARTRQATAKAAFAAAKKADAKRKAKAVLDQRAAEVENSVVALRTAQTAYRNTTTKLATATTAWRDANAVVLTAEQKLATAINDVGSAAQAAKISSQVVTDTRAGFTTADTTQVYGVTVNKTVGYAFQHMIEAAAHDGVPLSGGGFRTKQRQIELRTINGCPDIWTAPASSCKVPTAIPGRSLHEIGLAVDMTTGGKTIGSRDSVAFKWLAAHAAAYGFSNLPSEPWHWSITGG